MSSLADGHRFTYSINFAAFITAIADTVAVWGVPKAIDGVVIFFLLPAVLLSINSLGVRVRSTSIRFVSAKHDADLETSFTVSSS